MIDINLTLVIQALHFLLVWWALNKFLFPVLVQEAQIEIAHKICLETTLKEKKAVTASLSERLVAQWVMYKELFKKANPEPRESCFVPTHQTHKNPADRISDKELQDISNSTIQKIMTRIIP